MNEATKTQSAPVSTPECALTERLTQAEKQRDGLLLALQQVREDVRHAMGKAVTAFVKHGYAVKNDQPAGAAQAVTDFDQAMEEIRIATADTRPAANAARLPVAWRLTTTAPEGQKPLVFLIDNQGEATYAHSIWEGSTLTPLFDRAPAADAAGLRREARNKVCIDGHLNAALDDIMRSNSPDGMFNLLGALAGKAIDIALDLSEQHRAPATSAAGLPDEILCELVELRDLKAEYDAAPHMHHVYWMRAKLADYNARWPAAWERATAYRAAAKGTGGRNE